MQHFDRASLKHTLTTARIPSSAMEGLIPLEGRPSAGQVVVAEVLERRKHKSVEDPNGARVAIFVGDRIVGAFGNRYATDQYEGYVPDGPVRRCHLLSVGGVLGIVRSRHEAAGQPTRLTILGAVCDADGRPLNLREFGLPSIPDSGHGKVILVVGASMNSGKTTTAGTLARALHLRGLRVAAGKITGTAASHDTRFYASSGARPALDFTAFGYPSTYMLGRDELVGIVRSMLAHLRAEKPDFVVLEVADGILQRETRMLLESPELQTLVDHVFFSAADSLGVAYGVKRLREYGLPLRATSGLVSRSRLAIREAEEASGVPCLSLSDLLDGAVTDVLGVPPPVSELHGATSNGNGRVIYTNGAVGQKSPWMPVESVLPQPVQ